MKGRLSGLVDLSVMLLTWAACAQAHAETTAFFYGADVPPELTAAYDQLVVEPGHFRDTSVLPKGKAVPVAYVSLGEVAPTRANIDPAWVVGHNSAWSSRVMDLTHPGYRQFVLQHVDSLWAAGYRRFFLDTLDSYELGTVEPGPREAQRRALVTLIQTLATRHPQARWLLNRGFVLLPDVAAHVHGVVAESLFDRWDASASEYKRVPPQDRAWLLARLREVRERYRLPVTVIDYRPEAEREAALHTALKIAQLGFWPWVCNASLTNVGIGSLEILPRRVLVLTDTPESATDDATARQLEPVLEYLGYVPEYRALSQALPSSPLCGRYAGIISVLRSGSQVPDYGPWLLAQVRAGVRVAVFGALGFAADGPVAGALGIEPVPLPQPGAAPPTAAELTARDELVGFEAEPPAHGLEGVPVRLAGGPVQHHLALRLQDGTSATAIATTPWGGVALSHVFAMRGLHGERAWVLDPFTFLTRALRLPVMPVPDITTESGSRVALFVIDAQGAAEPARLRGRPNVWSVILQLLASHPWSHAIQLNNDGTEPRASDVAALRALLAAPAAYADTMRAGRTAPRDISRTLTELQPLYLASDSDPIVLPIAPDVSYYAGSTEAYALQRVIETFEYTDAPRRLRPIALHYHAFAASSPGGLDALDRVYTWLAQRPLFVVRIADYRARVLAFREQVIAQQLDGAYMVFGGEALRTLRVAAELGELDLDHSSAVAGSTVLPQGRYVTFAAHAPRRLVLAKSAVARPRLERTNGRVERWSWHAPRPGALRVELEVNAEAPVTLAIAGLAPRTLCTFACASGTLSLRTDEHGCTRVALPVRSTGAAALTCGSAAP